MMETSELLSRLMVTVRFGCDQRVRLLRLVDEAVILATPFTRNRLPKGVR